MGCQAHKADVRCVRAEGGLMRQVGSAGCEQVAGLVLGGAVLGLRAMNAGPWWLAGDWLVTGSQHLVRLASMCRAANAFVEARGSEHNRRSPCAHHVTV